MEAVAGVMRSLLADFEVEQGGAGLPRASGRKVRGLVQ